MELQWTHNGLYEWVAVDRVRVELPSMGQRHPNRGTPESRSPPESNNKKRRAPSSPGKEGNSEHQKERISPEKGLPEEEKSDLLEKTEGDFKEEKSRNPEVTNSVEVKDDKPIEDEDTEDDTEETATDDSEKKESETTMEVPPSKKRKIESDHSIFLASGFFASLGQQVVDAKNAFVSGFQEIYKELLGPQ